MFGAAHGLARSLRRPWLGAVPAAKDMVGVRGTRMAKGHPHSDRQPCSRLLCLCLPWISNNTEYYGCG
jgi:hypothetical protein